MDHTHSTHFVKDVITYVLENGGSYWPSPEAFDLKGWAVLNQNDPETILGWVKLRKIPYRSIGNLKYVTPADMWGAMTVCNSPEPAPGKGGKKRDS